LLNGREVEGEQELHAQDRLEVGPLAFQVRIEDSPAALFPASPPVDEDEAAAVLLESEEPADDSLDRGNPASSEAEAARPEPQSAVPSDSRTRQHRPSVLDEHDASEAAGALLNRYTHKPRLKRR
jgi:hypothetical protein